MPSEAKHRPVACPMCGGTGKHPFATDEPGMPIVDSVCPGCMGSKTVHPYKGKQLENDREVAYQRVLREQQPF